MSNASGQPSLNPAEEGELPVGSEGGIPQNWKEAIPCLISSRIAIIRTESKDVVGGLISKIVLLGIAAFCLLLVWLLLITGAIGAIAAASTWEWFHVAFAAAGAHALIALIAFLIARSRTPTIRFPITRDEFKKDREWLNQLKKPSSSEG
jgi:uncharacterized membrane protein YqjE